jgi:hypothetical protein
MDLPSFREMQTQARTMKLLSFMMKPDDRRKIKELESNLVRVVREVDDFYDKLGDRHWIYHDQMPTTLVSGLVSADVSTDAAEMALCAHYADEDVLRRLVMGTMKFPAMRARQKLVQAAQRDFHEGRYYSVVLVLLTVLDGFVNDVQSARRGLHARDPEELQSFDTAVGHHKGLTATQASFRKSYFKRDDNETHDLARNGILHGMLTNFDNQVVASKAWNRLFAVVDWATSLDKEAKPEEPKPTWGELFRRLGEGAQHKNRLDKWSPSRGDVGDGLDVSTIPILVAAKRFLDLWSQRNWGHLAFLFRSTGKGPGGKTAPKEVKASFSPYQLDGYRLIRYELSAPAVGEVTAELVVAGVTFTAALRMTFEGENGESRVEGAEPGTWRMYWRSPDMFNRDMVQVANFRA